MSKTLTTVKISLKWDENKCVYQRFKRIIEGGAPSTANRLREGEKKLATDLFPSFQEIGNQVEITSSFSPVLITRIPGS